MLICLKKLQQIDLKEKKKTQNKPKPTHAKPQASCQKQM